MAMTAPMVVVSRALVRSMTLVVAVSAVPVSYACQTGKQEKYGLGNPTSVATPVTDSDGTGTTSCGQSVIDIFVQGGASD